MREKFEEYIAEKGLEPLPEYYTNSERIGFRFLQGCGWNYEAAYNGILENQKWRQETFPMDQAKFTDFLQSGSVYVCGRASPGF